MIYNAMQEIFGLYAPIDGCTNWTYISGVVVFCICLYSMFRMLAVVLKR